MWSQLFKSASATKRNNNHKIVPKLIFISFKHLVKLLRPYGTIVNRSIQENKKN